MRLPLALIIALAPGLVQHVQEIFTVGHRDQLELLGHRMRRFRLGAGRAKSRRLNKKQRRRRFHLPRFHLTLPSLSLTHQQEETRSLSASRNEAAEKKFEVSFQRGSQLWWAFFLGSLVMESTKTALTGGGAGPVGHLVATMLPIGALARQPVVAAPKASVSRWLLATFAKQPAPPPPLKASASRWLLALMLPTTETLRQPVVAPPRAAVSPSRWLPAHRRATQVTPRQTRKSTIKRNASSSSSIELTRKRRAASGTLNKNKQQQRPRKKPKKIKQDEELWPITRLLIPQEILDSHRGRVAGRKHKW